MLTDSQRTALAARLRRGRDMDVIARRDGGAGELPLSYGQEQLWFIDRFAPGLATYNIPLALWLSGALDAGVLGRAVDGLVARHEALRTRLVAGGSGRPVQVIDTGVSVPVAREDLSGLAAGVRAQRLREFLTAEASRPFDLARDRLLRTALVRLADAEHVLLFVVHHAVFDGWSAGVLVAELAALYRAEVTGAPAGLAELPVQFADFALWQRQHLHGATLAGLEDYWQAAMNGFGTVQFPTDRPRPAVDDFAGGLVQLHTDAGLLAGLRELSRREGTTLFVTLMAALQVLLYRYTGQTDLVVGTVSANRSRGELAPLIGFLVNTLPIRADLSGDPPFTALLTQLQETTLGAYAHQDLPFGKLVETLGVERDPSRAPVFQIALTYAERDHAPVTAAGLEFFLTDLIVGIEAAKFDLTFLAEARADGLWFECSYKSALFDPGTVRRLLYHLEVLLRGILATPAARLSQLPMLTEEELYQELTGWNDTAAELPPGCVHKAFEAQVARAPGAVAAQFGPDQLTYAQLNALANQIARRLRELGAGPRVLVGVCMTASLRRLAVLLAIWKAGGGYVPLDPALPPDRLSFMLADADLPVVVTDAASAGSVPGGPAGPARVLSLDADWNRLCCLADGNLAGPGASPADVAYVIYTSGSTGQPKGVMVEHRQVTNFTHGMIEQWKIGPSDTVLGFAAFTFDVSVLDMFMPLLAGARLVLAATSTLHSPPRLIALLRTAGITFACLPPAVLSLLGDETFSDLRVLMAAGEELPAELARRWVRPGLRFINGYGPTEATVIAAHHELDGTEPVPPIGLPTWPNYQVYVLDQFLNPVPAGVTGELHIGGAGVARGYLNRPELTRERFIADPFRPGGRLYKTGDLVRRRRDGTIVFVGRADNQVKIRGLRVELGEIEAVLAAHPAVAQAVVTVVAGPGGDQQLAGYLRAEPGAVVTAAELRDHLTWRLPAYLIPGHLTILDRFPLNPSGKIDKSALPAPQAGPAAGHRELPQTLLETALADFYATVLDIEQVGATDSFFDLGGNSLQAMRLVSAMDHELDVDVSVAAIFLAPTPRQLAALLRDQHGFEDTDLADGDIDGLDQLCGQEPPGTETAGA